MRTAPELEFALEIRAEVGEPVVVGPMPAGLRRIVPIVGGSFEGPGLRGRIEPGGADWQLIGPDGLTEAEARYTLVTEAGERICVVNRGIRHAPAGIIERLNAGEQVDPGKVYFRTVPRFETASPEHAWLMRSVFVATGERAPREVLIRCWRVL